MYTPKYGKIKVYTSSTTGCEYCHINPDHEAHSWIYEILARGLSIQL